MFDDFDTRALAFATEGEKSEVPGVCKRRCVAEGGEEPGHWLGREAGEKETVGPQPQWPLTGSEWL